MNFARKMRKKSDMPAPPPKKKRKPFKPQMPKINPITNYFNIGSRTSQTKQGDEQKADACIEEEVDTEMHLCEDLPNKLSSQVSLMSELSPFTFCPESQDADCSQSESDWLKTTMNGHSNHAPIARQKYHQISTHRTAFAVQPAAALMRSLSIESSQSYLTPSDQPTHAPSVAQMDQSILANRRGTPKINGTFEPPPPCYVNPFISQALQREQKEINLRGSGKYFREYKQEGRIGSGSFGDVFKCRNRYDGCVYAVKRQTIGSRHVSVERVKREARMFAALSQSSSCPNLVRHVQSWQEDSAVYIAMEYCEEGTLSTRLGQPMSTDTLVRIFEDIGNALREMHRFNFVHLDVKPSNILVTKEFHFKLSDFGLTARADLCEDDDDEISEGDKKYLCQELLNNSYHKQQLDKMDVFSLGASVYEMYLGKPLPGDGLEWELLRSSEGFCFREKTDPFVKELIQKTMYADCDARPTANELVNVIRERKAQLPRQVREQAALIKEQDEELERLRSMIARFSQK